MENPAQDVIDVVRGLVDRPTLKGQADVLEKYFTKDVEFYHYYINTTGGRKDLTSIYQMAELVVHYQGVEFQKIMYDEKDNSVALRMSVFTRPLGILPQVTLKFFTLLELEDCKLEGGKIVKKIKVQRDYFERSPLLLMIPVFGSIYDSDNIRTLIGSLQAATFDFLRSTFSYFFPASLYRGVLDLWHEDVAKIRDAGGIKLA